MELNGTRVVITGGSGFIGSHLVRRLVQSGSKVAITTRYSNLIKNVRLKNLWDSIHVIEADLRNRGALVTVRDFRPEVVFHLAAYNHVGQSFTQVEECFDVNAKGTANLLDVCTDVRRFVYISTSEIYGDQTQVPFVETMHPGPQSPYAITKYCGEMYCRMKQRMASDGCVVILRPFNAFGPEQSTKAVIPELIGKALRGEPIQTTPGEQTREFNYVDNLIEGMVLAGFTTKKLEGPINLAGGEEIQIKDLVRRIADLTGSRSELRIGAFPYRPNEIWRMHGDFTRARELLGWKPRVSFDEGLQKTVRWYVQASDKLMTPAYGTE